MSVKTKCYKTEYKTIYLVWVIPYQINMSLALAFLISLQFGALKAIYWELRHTNVWAISPITFEVMTTQKFIEQLNVIYMQRQKLLQLEIGSTYHVIICFTELGIHFSFRWFVIRYSKQTNHKKVIFTLISIFKEMVAEISFTFGMWDVYLRTL